ncbi:MAG: hypothetical protein PHF84_10070 [bacterium]|nr:hypothetical protein [bacterium]
MRTIFSVLMALSLLAVGFQLEAGTTNTNLTVWATATVESSPMALTIDIFRPGRQNGIDFGSVRAVLGDIRFQATNRAVLDYFPGSNPIWYLMVYSQNQDGKTNDMGLMNDDTSPTNYAPLKVWCANYGPSGFGNGNNPPYAGSEENTYLWGGLDLNTDGDKTDVFETGSYSEATWDADFNGDGDKIDTWDATPANPLSEGGAGWNWVWDKDHTLLSSSLTKRVLCSKEGQKDNSLPSPFNAYFAMEAAGMKNGLYDTKITFEMDTQLK